MVYKKILFHFYFLFLLDFRIYIVHIYIYNISVTKYFSERRYTGTSMNSERRRFYTASEPRSSVTSQVSQMQVKNVNINKYGYTLF